MLLLSSLFLFFSLLFLAKQKLMKCQEKRRKRENRGENPKGKKEIWESREMS
jgi:hypothetical protein